MSIPMKAVDRLFERLAATYGAQWTRQWADVPISDVKTAWAHELSPFAGWLEALAWALENLPAKCPNAIEFKAICRKAPPKDTPRIEPPKADPARVAAELAKLADARKAASSGGYDQKAWARRIIAQHDGGDKVRPISLRFAREALRITQVTDKSH